jgi:hypothetical protein
MLTSNRNGPATNTKATANSHPNGLFELQYMQSKPPSSISFPQLGHRVVKITSIVRNDFMLSENDHNVNNSGVPGTNSRIWETTNIDQ